MPEFKFAIGDIVARRVDEVTRLTDVVIDGWLKAKVGVRPYQVLSQIAETSEAGTILLYRLAGTADMEDIVVRESELVPFPPPQEVKPAVSDAS